MLFGKWVSLLVLRIEDKEVVMGKGRDKREKGERRGKKERERKRGEKEG